MFETAYTGVYLYPDKKDLTEEDSDDAEKGNNWRRTVLEEVRGTRIWSSVSQWFSDDINAGDLWTPFRVVEVCDMGWKMAFDKN